MPDIDDKWIDVDFEQDPCYTFGDLGANVFGATPYEQRFGVMSDAEIDAAIDEIDAAGGGMDLLVTRIYDQKQEGSCVANATCQSHEIKQCQQFGADAVVHLSAMSLYKRIGTSAQSGAMVSDGWDEMKKRGILPLDTPENREKYGQAVMPNTGWSTRYPPGWEATAKKFSGLEAWVVNTVLGLFTALCVGHPVVVGRQGHSICYVRPMRQGGRRVVKYANSWGTWGDNGYGYDTQSQINQSARWAFAVRSIRAPT